MIAVSQRQLITQITCLLFDYYISFVSWNVDLYKQFSFSILYNLVRFFFFFFAFLLFYLIEAIDTQCCHSLTVRRLRSFVKKACTIWILREPLGSFLVTREQLKTSSSQSVSLMTFCSIQIRIRLEQTNRLLCTDTEQDREQTLFLTILLLF